MNKLLPYILMLLPAILNGQTESVVIEWDTDHGNLHFPHALYEGGPNTLPYYTRKIEWNEPGMLPVVRVEVRETARLTGIVPDQASADRLESAPLLEAELVRESGRNYLMIKILPFVRNASGGIDRVNSFRIRVASGHRQQRTDRPGTGGRGDRRNRSPWRP